VIADDDPVLRQQAMDPPPPAIDRMPLVLPMSSTKQWSEVVMNLAVLAADELTVEPDMRILGAAHDQAPGLSVTRSTNCPLCWTELHHHRADGCCDVPAPLDPAAPPACGPKSPTSVPGRRPDLRRSTRGLLCTSAKAMALSHSS